MASRQVFVGNKWVEVTAVMAGVLAVTVIVATRETTRTAAQSTAQDRNSMLLTSSQSL